MPTTDAEIQPVAIICNGETRQVEPGTTVAGLLIALGLEPEMMAVELDGRILARQDYESTTLAAGARLELIRFVGGGSDA
ncbi:MAG: sulfur carrier protein ThiS [Desulfurivibrio sp.]|nr:sulfur carrier protein ThiS [Desulfurivibrio sp.]